VGNTSEEILAAHVARMRLINEAEIRQTARLGTLNTLLIYRTGTASLKANEQIDQIMEQIIIESGATNLPGDPGGRSGGSGGISNSSGPDPAGGDPPG